MSRFSVWDWRWEPVTSVDDRKLEGWEEVPERYPSTEARRVVTFTHHEMTHVLMRRRSFMETAA